MLIIATLLFLLGNHSVELEEATSWEQKSWGLMGRTELGENEGMLFPFNPPQIVNVWMFNCWIDLDVAFLDADKTVREIHEMKAFPDKMDPLRPVLSPNDIQLYPPDDPIRIFFQNQSVTSSFKASYILEMPHGWFKKNNVKIGAKLM